MLITHFESKKMKIYVKTRIVSFRSWKNVCRNAAEFGIEHTNIIENHFHKWYNMQESVLNSSKGRLYYILTSLKLSPQGGADFALTFGKIKEDMYEN